MQTLTSCATAAPAWQHQHKRQRRRTAAAPAASAVPARQEDTPASCPSLDRRMLLAGAMSLAAASACQPALAVQGITAGRIPGVSGPDADGYYTYQRPEGKSGGHGVGWSELQRYSFKVPANWEESPVSIADLGGTEIDLRYRNPDQGNLFVVVAPVARFRDIPFNTTLNIAQLGDPQTLIAGFAPELYGGPLAEGEVLDTKVVEHDGMPYYFWELSRHRLVGAAATGNRLYMIAINAKSIQWRKYGDELIKIRDSFRVPVKAAE